jgi:CheY-like chemotaxis protein
MSVSHHSRPSVLVVDEEGMMRTMARRLLEEELRGRGLAPASTSLRQKPFMPARLVAAVRDALEQGPLRR